MCHAEEVVPLSALDLSVYRTVVPGGSVLIQTLFRIPSVVFKAREIVSGSINGVFGWWEIPSFDVQC